MTAVSGLFNPAGGIGYHLQSFKGRKLWDFHRQCTSQWLSTWQPKAARLVLIGPSAGYSLPDQFLRSFQEVIALDVDPLALSLLRLRFPHMNLKCRLENYLVTSKRSLWREGLFVLKAKYLGSAFLFCNVIGQLPLLAKDFKDGAQEWAKNFETFAAETDWASYHDLWSANARTRETIWVPPEVSGDERLRESISIFINPNEKSEIRDHETANLFKPEFERMLWTWQRTRSEVHCIEGVRASKQLAGA